jgi:hypothetical protein
LLHRFLHKKLTKLLVINYSRWFIGTAETQCAAVPTQPAQLIGIIQKIRANVSCFLDDGNSSVFASTLNFAVQQLIASNKRFLRPNYAAPGAQT